MFQRSILITSFVLVATSSLFLAGCQATKVPGPLLTVEHGGNTVDEQMTFWHELNSRPMTSNDEAFHGLLLLIDGEDGAADYEARVANLVERGLLAKNFDASADDAVLRGTVAFVIVKALDIKGGAVMRTFGPSPRYALRELVYMNMLEPSSTHQTFSGAAFVSLVGRVDDYERSRAAATEVQTPQDAADDKANG